MTTPKDVWTALRAKGATVNQAIGIMANVMNESSFNPEAIGDQGTSFGIVQQHGTQYASLVTGNPQADLTAQVNTLALNGGFKAASGSSPADAAGNFAANYERCVGCQQGGAQNNARRANAAVVAGWVKSGNFPASAGASSAAASASGNGTSAQAGADCAFSLGGQHIGVLFGHGPTLPTACLIRKTEVRAVMGGLILAAGFLVMLPGVVLVAMYGLRTTRAGQVIVQGLNRGAMAQVVQKEQAQAAQARQARQAQAAQARQIRQQNAQARQAAGSQAQQRRAVRGQAPRQQPPKPAPKPPPAVHHGP